MEVEVNSNFKLADDVFKTVSGGVVAITPPIGEDFWIARVVLRGKQAIVCFPKFFTVGCGFAQEKDWNTNLPLSQPAETIFNHIAHNKKYKAIKDEDCIEAIRMLQKTILPAFERAKKVTDAT
jgi:hypothetical protein